MSNDHEQPWQTEALANGWRKSTMFDESKRKDVNWFATIYIEEAWD